MQGLAHRSGLVFGTVPVVTNVVRVTDQAGALLDLSRSSVLLHVQ